MEERRYTTMKRFPLALNLLIPVLIVVTLIVANVIAWDAGGTRRPPLWWSAFIGAFGLFFGVRTALLAHQITIRPGGHIEFQRLLGSIVVPPTDIHFIGRSLLRPFLSINTEHAWILVPNEWTGLHEFIEYVRKNNPALQLKGM